MTDNLTKEARRYNMFCVKDRNTKPEIIVRKYLFAKGLRYRINVKALPGSPDIVLPKYKTIVFVNGCFWHKHNCTNFIWPKSHQEYWERKILGNVSRDKKNINILKKAGWNVIIVWECELTKNKIDDRLSLLLQEVKGT